MHTPLRHLRACVSRSRPIHLTFFVTRRCNARCPFCFYAPARDDEGGAPELSLDEIRRVAASMGDLLWVLFSGGEVFLRDDLVAISKAFHDLNHAAFLTYPTNALLPEVIAERTERILEACPESVVVVKLSLDGVGDRHDQLRRVPGAFEKLLRTHRLLADLAGRRPNLELGVNTLFCAPNQREMEEIIGFVRGLDGIRSHTISLVRGETTDPAYKAIDAARYRDACLELERNGKTVHRFRGSVLKAALDRVQRKLIHQTLLEQRRMAPCYAGRLNLVLTERGELHPCEERRDLGFGNVREAGYDVGKLLASERARRLLGEIAGGGCHCTHECNWLTNILFNPAMHPALVSSYARLMFRPADGQRRTA